MLGIFKGPLCPAAGVMHLCVCVCFRSMCLWRSPIFTFAAIQRRTTAGGGGKGCSVPRRGPGGFQCPPPLGYLCL